MENLNLTPKDLSEIEAFKNGYPWMNIISAATPGHGIKVLSENEVEQAVKTAENAGSQNVVMAKFVPASGAASRMFKDLFNKNVSVVNNFVSNIEKFAFYDPSLYVKGKEEEFVDFTLTDKGLNYGVKPKGVLKFHKYASEVRTAIAEHLVEAQEYMKGSDKVAHLVVTVSPEHKELFEQAIAEVRAEYEARYDVKYDIELVFQYKWTDTIAVNPDNTPFLLDDGTALHRPAGHGALIHNLNAVNADVVSIKNIDNVSVESYLPVTAKWKKVLIGTALEYRSKIFSLIDALRANGNDAQTLECAKNFLASELFIELPKGAEVNAELLLSILNRPIRVCGMVRNQGEPGGGPFVIREKDGSTSLQVLEGPQINPNDPHAVECLKGATHFNPVDLVCVLTDRDGNKFDLPKYVDPEAGFISSKSFQGRELKALELPGLWNGSMSRWNTVFVEVPVETFNPVKTVMDLLRPAHQ